MTNALVTHYFEDLKVGMSGSFAKTLSEADVEAYAGITGDEPSRCARSGVTRRALKQNALASLRHYEQHLSSLPRARGRPMGARGRSDRGLLPSRMSPGDHSDGMNTLA